MTVPTFSRQYSQYARSFRQLLDRLGARCVVLRHRMHSRMRSWSRWTRWADRKAAPLSAPVYLNFPVPYAASIHRDVTPNGVRVYSLCGECGSRLNASATLCEECAQKRSRPARPH